MGRRSRHESGNDPTHHSSQFEVESHLPSGGVPNVVHRFRQIEDEIHPPRPMDPAHIHSWSPTRHPSPYPLVICLPKASGTIKILDKHTILVPGVRLTIERKMTPDSHHRARWVTIDMEPLPHAHTTGRDNEMLTIRAVPQESTKHNEYLHPRWV